MLSGAARLLMILSGTGDARGLRQWNDVGRKVKKGAKAFHILAPNTIKKKISVEDPDTGELREEQRLVITGFRLIPVFRLEDTQGAPLPEVDYAPPEPPPLFEVATKLGVDVKYGPGDGSCYGSFTPGANRIDLYSHDVKTFFHELAHAAHNTVRPLKGGQDPVQEVVAETVACTLCELYGYTGYTYSAWQYIKSYALPTGPDDAKRDGQALKFVMKVLGDVEQVLKRIWKLAKPTEKAFVA